MNDYYRVLGLNEGASDADVDEAYKRLISKHHPDRHASSGAEIMESATRMTQKINEAYRILSDSRHASGAQGEEPSSAPVSGDSPRANGEDARSSVEVEEVGSETPERDDGENEETPPPFGLKYFDLGKAWDDFHLTSFGAKEKSVSAAKLFGKLAANVGILATEIGVDLVKDLPRFIAEDMPKAVAKAAERELNSGAYIEPERRARLEETVRRYKERHENPEAEETE